MNSHAERLRAEATDELLVGPIGGELLGTEHLAARARAIARGQRLVVGRRALRPARLLERLAATRRILANAHERLTTVPSDEIDAGPAAAWLLDNYHVVQEHLQEVQASLPGGYYRELPELDSGPLSGYPRVYEMAISLISHTEARIDIENVELYVEAFQSVTPLSLGELWAMPAMLRLGLIESVRRLTLRTVQRLDEIELADYWANRIMLASARGGADLRASLREFADGEHALTPNFVSRFLQTMRQAEGASSALAWLEHWLREAGVSPEHAAAQHTQKLALTQIMMANSIMSLRRIGRCDWREFVERQSAMEAILRADPPGVYECMTFDTRDLYRHAVERIAKGTGRSEIVVAQWAIDLALEQHASPNAANEPYRSHVGYYLVDDGLAELERKAGYTPTVRERVRRLVHCYPDVVLIGGITLCTLLALAAVLGLAESEARGSLWLVLMFTFLPALDIAVNTLNQLVTTWLPPYVLPRIDLYEHGIPSEYRTAVVMPVLFNSEEDVREALDNLEVQFLANRESHLIFAILSDFTDAPVETLPTDAGIVDAALTGVRALNERYAPDAPEAFHLLHRPRRWNARQGVWMGWERKRGKLADFNALLRGGAADAFSELSSDPTVLQDVQFVITLDADTVLPPDAAPALVGAMAHPLNRAVYDASERKMVRGYGILQPRVGVSLPSANRSRFASIASGYPGVDPYSTAVSDVYQDLYGEGSFTGKGIYDVDAFQLATHGRFPENTLLSHDLIEGNYARAGLVTDVIVYDDYPTSYVAASLRKHRWIRGDWQLLPWLRRTVPGPDGPERNRLSLLSQWKILDNLRRSTVELSQVLLLLAAWTVLPGSAVRWTFLGLGAVVAPWVTSLLIAIVRPPFDKSWRAYYSAVAQDAVMSAEQAVVAIVMLPHQAYLSADAIVRTIYRLLVSRRYLLAWQSALLVERRVSESGVSQSWRTMRSAVLLLGAFAIATSIVAVRRQLESGASWQLLIEPALAMWCIVGIWLMAPRIADALSRASIPVRAALSSSARAVVKRYAEAHWRFFERHVTEETHWLAPDNFQATPEPVVAMRTSPTNMGLQLLATVSAHDLGLITAEDATSRLERTFATLATLRRYRGHFYNWYDLTDLHVLEPRYISTVDSGNIAGHLIALRQACLQLADEHPALRDRLTALADRSYAYVSEMEFGFLFDPTQQLFTIGYHPDSFTADDSFYDLLASEARLASFIAIAKNDVPTEHWFRLSRALNHTSGAAALVSWSGSMFEYLMPILVMRSLPFTLLHQTYHGAVHRQRTFARARRVPWGVSESAYNLRDRHHTYQYRAFGVPDLALKRGLGRDLVIAPYASALAIMVDPPRAVSNLLALEALGTLSDIGFCDSLDYTRPAVGERFAAVRAYMAHHIGMSLVAFTNVLHEDRWQERFHRDALVKAAELLLHERVPRRLVMHDAQEARPDEAAPNQTQNGSFVREIDPETVHGRRVALLGASPYTVMLDHTGSGYSRYQSLAVTRWRADDTAGDTGQFCYLKDVESGRVWSAAQQPIGSPADSRRVFMASDRITLLRTDDDLETKTEITVVPADAAEVRAVTLSNFGRTTREIELTSYGEVVMAPSDSDRAHPAFSNLFVETEWHSWCTAITATRRPRTPDEPQLWCVHVVDAGRERIGEVTCETDRAQFIGRGRSVRDPHALDEGATLSGSTGPVLDPVFALRTRVRVAPGQSVRVAFTTLVATTREQAFELAGRYHDPHATQRALELAWTSTQIELNELGISPTNAAVFQDLAEQLIFRGGSLAPPTDEVRRNRGSQPRLWSYGISGDRPILMATIDSVAGLPTLRDLFAAHRYWRRRGLDVDLVVINAQAYDYLQELRDGIMEAMVAADDVGLIDKPGGVHVRRREVFLPDDYLMLTATARVLVACDGRSLGRVLATAEAHASAARALAAVEEERRQKEGAMASASGAYERPGTIATIISALRPLVAPLKPRNAPDTVVRFGSPQESSPLRGDNGVGGMDQHGEYRMVIDERRLPPAPWANVIANALGGFLVSERGSGCTWAENAYFYRLTPWHNDPVSDPTSDVLFLRDEESGESWSATPAPMRHKSPYRVRHGAGSSTFDHERDEIVSTLTVGMPPDAAVKTSLLRLQNRSDRTRHITVTAYVEWTLGARREQTRHQVRTRYVPEQHAIFAQNHFDDKFAEWTAFVATSEAVSSHTADRRTFIGDGGSLADPAGLRGGPLDGRTGVALDPCGALQMQLVLAAGESRDVTVLLGATRTEAEAKRLLDRLRRRGAANAAVSRSVSAWEARLATIDVRTPNADFDAMLNKWTLYQTLSCRVWARMGLYQSSGAYGFRDQLQDVMALLYAEPDIAREHILRASARQFVEGDVQHWWHAHSGRGVRTRFSDDLAWLPYVVNQYLRVTGDASLLEEYVPFLTMRALGPDEHEVYDLPAISDEHGSVYEHCRRALRRACTVGAHGLPLIGTGDWNDGMSRVGAAGAGESVWLAWFLIVTLREFAEHAAARGDAGEAADMRQKADAYVASVEANGWDGQWYRRAYYDDGTPMGSASNDECRIDSIAQSWSVISGAGSPARQQMAMASLNAQLVREDARLIMLLTPPFDRGTHDPGYIKGYVPGVRENGAQYTHAALWAVMAEAMRGDGDRAFDLFQMLNPLTHAFNAEEMGRYKVEPYVVAADVYTAPSQLGRGGWTWYTGSASWMYRVGLEQILGFTKVGNTLRITPCVPAAWPSYEIRYQFGGSRYEIQVRDPAGIRERGARFAVDGVPSDEDALTLVDDGRAHTVVVSAQRAAVPALASTSTR